MDSNERKVSLQNRCTICGKPLSPTSGDVGATCKAHEGKLKAFAKTAEVVPDGYIRMSKVCQAAVEQGLTIGQVVNAAGGDAATKPILDPVFEVIYVGRGKYMNPDVMTKGFAILKEHLNAPKEKGQKAKPAPISEALSNASANEKALKQVVKS